MSLHPSRLESNLCFPVVNLGISCSWKSWCSRGPGLLSWPRFYLEFLQWVKGVFSFRGKGKEKRIQKSSFPLPQTCLPYFLWRVAEIFTLIGSRVPPPHNFPGNISPRFWLLCKLSATTPLYSFSDNHIWTHHPRYNRQDNALPCISQTHDANQTVSVFRFFRMQNKNAFWGVFSFRGKGKEKRIQKSSFPLPQTCLPYFLWRVAEIFTLIGSRVPPPHNFPGNISPRFWLLCKLSATTPLYSFSDNHIWTHHPRYNRQDNALPCISQTHDANQTVSVFRFFRMQNKNAFWKFQQMRAQKRATIQPLFPVPERYQSHTIDWRHLKHQDIQRKPQTNCISFLSVCS